MRTSDDESKIELPSEIIVGDFIQVQAPVADLLGRNIKRRLQQLETFTQGVSIDTKTSKEKQHPSQISYQASIQSEKLCLHTITPAASDTLLSDIDTTAVSTVESSDTSSIEVALFSSKEDTHQRTSLPDQEDCDIASQQEHDKIAAFYSMTPLTDLENDVAFFVRPT
jgi:hypothetical protein